MRRRYILFFALLAFAVTRPAVARLWETEQQLQARYGPPIKKIENSPDGGKFYTYRFKEYNILVSIIGGKSENEFYVRQDRKPLTTTQITFFLLQISEASGDRWWWDRRLPMKVLGQNWKAVSVDFNRVPTTDSPGVEVCTLSYARRVNLISTEKLPQGIPTPPPS